MRCFLQIIELSHKQVQQTDQMEQIRNQAVRHDQETKIPALETISKIQNTIPISETTKTQIDNSVVVSKQAASLPAKQNEMKLDNPTTAAIISGCKVDTKSNHPKLGIKHHGSDQLALQQQLKCRITVNCNLQFETIAKRDEHERTFQHFNCEHCNIGFWTWAEWQRKGFELIISSILSACLGCFSNLLQNFPTIPVLSNHMSANYANWTIQTSQQRHRNEDPNCKALNCPICDKSFRHIKQGYKKSKLKETFQPFPTEFLQNFILAVIQKTVFGLQYFSG